MKRLHDYDRFSQGIPRNKKMSDLETGRLHVVGTTYVKLEDFKELQDNLTEMLDKQETTLEQMLDEIRQLKMHLASMSDATTESGDGEE